jgi:hypothetical protein
MTGEDGLGSRRGAASAPQKAHVTGAYGKPVAVMNENRRCSIVFHLLVPGGKWPTVMGMPSLSASFSCTRTCSGDPLGRHSHPPFLKIADQLLLLGVDRNRRFTSRKRLLYTVVDIAKLRIAIRVVRSLACLGAVSISVILPL